MYPRRLFSISKTFNIHPQQWKKSLSFSTEKKMFLKNGAVHMDWETRKHLCNCMGDSSITNVLKSLYHFYHPVTLVTVINPWNWQDTSCQGREAWVIFEGKIHSNGEKRDGTCTTKSNTEPDSSVVMFQGYGFDSGLSLIIFFLHSITCRKSAQNRKVQQVGGQKV